jgi:hypothetical protein
MARRLGTGMTGREPKVARSEVLTRTLASCYHRVELDGDKHNVSVCAEGLVVGDFG